MSVDQRNVIDAIGTDKQSGAVRLSIFDHLAWDEPLQHLEILQNKINDYFGFIQSGQIFKVYPATKGKKLGIDVYFKFSPPEGDISRFLNKAKEIAGKLGVSFAYGSLPKVG